MTRQCCVQSSAIHLFFIRYSAFRNPHLNTPTFIWMPPLFVEMGRVVPIFASYEGPCTQPEVPEPLSDPQKYEPLSHCARWQSELRCDDVRRSLRPQPSEVLLRLGMQT